MRWLIAVMVAMLAAGMMAPAQGAELEGTAASTLSVFPADGGRTETEHRIEVTGRSPLGEGLAYVNLDVAAGASGA